MMLSAVIFVLTLAAATIASQEGVYFEIEDGSFLLDENPFADETADSLMLCPQKCSRESLCRSANFWQRERKCSLLNKTRRDRPEELLRQAGYVHLEKLQIESDKEEADGQESISLLGLSKDSAVTNCQDLKHKVPLVRSGVYWINPDGGSHRNVFQAYCDQETHGGGWTLVWSYTFTNYSSFTSNSNAVTPRPNWPVNTANTRVSTTPPLNETHYEAVDFYLWREIGNQTLVKSNINNWIACDKGNGSLVLYQKGPLSCKKVKQVSKLCPGVVPDSVKLRTRGPTLVYNGTNYYYFDGNVDTRFPAHDPCGSSKGNQLKGVSDPHGNIYVR